MALVAEKKSEVVQKYRPARQGHRVSEVQVALITERIAYLTEHFKTPQEGPPQAAAACSSWSGSGVGSSTTSGRSIRTATRS